MTSTNELWAEYATEAESMEHLRDGLLEGFMDAYEEGVQQYVRLAEEFDTPPREIAEAVKKFDANLHALIRAAAAWSTELCDSLAAMHNKANA